MNHQLFCIFAYLNSIDIDPKLNLLLVCNCTTTKDEIVRWTGIAVSLGLTLVVWNLSMYNGFCYDCPGFNLCENFQDGVVVLLNSPFPRTGGKGTMVPVEYLNGYDIFEAARRHGIRTYIINASTDPPATLVASLCMPMAELADTSIEAHSNRKSLSSAKHTGAVESPLCEHLAAQYERVVIKSTHVFTSPNEQNLLDKIPALEASLVKANPSHRYYHKYHFSPTKLSGSFLQSHQYGTIEVRRGLDSAYAMIAVRNWPLASQHTALQDAFAVYKLKPFQFKLQRFAVTLDEFSWAGVLSDLIDEQYAYHTHSKQYGQVPKDRLVRKMKVLKAFAAFDFTEVAKVAPAEPRTPGATRLLTLLVRIRAFASYHRGYLVGTSTLKEVVKDVCAAMLAAYFPTVDSRSEFRALRRNSTPKAFMNKAPIGAKLKEYCDPYDLGYTAADGVIAFNHTGTQIPMGVPAMLISTTAPTPHSPPTSSTISAHSTYTYSSTADQQADIARFAAITTFRKEETTSYYANSEGKVVLDSKAEQGAARKSFC